MKNFLMKIILYFLYRGIKVLNGRDSEITNELKALPNGYSVKISTDLKNSKQMAFKIFDGKVQKAKNQEYYDLQIIFKSKHLAYKVFMGKKSIADAYAEHYFQMFGNIYLAMGITRIIERVEGYLFPRSVNKKLIKIPFKRQISMFKTYLLCLF